MAKVLSGVGICLVAMSILATPVALWFGYAHTVVDLRTKELTYELLGASSGGQDSEAIGLVTQHPELLNAADEQGWTALHEASRAGDAYLVAELLGRGACATARNADGRTPYDEAMRAHEWETARLLKEVS